MSKADMVGAQVDGITRLLLEIYTKTLIVSGTENGVRSFFVPTSPL
jgi:hypothetical protein